MVDAATTAIFSNVKAKFYLPFRMILPVPTILARRARRGGSFVSSSSLHPRARSSSNNGRGLRNWHVYMALTYRHDDDGHLP
jgi:hypothetical protein